MTRFRFQGTGETIGGSSTPALLVIAALLLLGSGGAVAAVAAALVDALIAVVVVVVLVVAALAAFVVHLARHPGSPLRGIVPAPALHVLPAPERPALAPKAAPAVVNHYHLHVEGGTDLSGLGFEAFRRDAVTEKEK